MKSELNNYGIKNPDGMIRNRFGEVRQTFSNDGGRFVRETPVRGQREVNGTPETFDPGKAQQTPAPAQPKVNAASDYQAIADQTLTATSSTASAASGAAAASASATAAATGGATAGAATAAAATAATGAAAAVGTIAATVATAVIVVAVFVSTLAINLSLLLAGMTSLVFRVEMTGAQDEDFETPIWAIITDGDEYYDTQEVYRDTLLLTFEGLTPDTEYTVTVRNEEKVFFERTYVTATEEVDRGFLSAWNEGNEIFIIVEGVRLDDRERFTVSATDERGNVIFARDGVEEFAEYSFKLDKPRNLFFTLLVGGKMAAATEIRMLDDLNALYDFENPVWSWSEDHLTAEVSFGSFFDAEPLILTATVTESVDAEPDCENDGFATYYAAAYYEDREFFDETTEILPAFGHFYTAEFDWIEGGDGDYLGATATLTCSHNPDHTLELEAEVTREEFEATCDADAYVIYRAVVELDGETYDETKTEFREGTAYGEHLYPDLYAEEPDESAFTLTKNASGEVTAASLTLTCLRCNESQTIPATEVERMTWDANLCEDTEAEYYLFWDTDGIMEYAKYVTVPVTPTGHDYEAVYDWIKNQDGWYDGVNLILTCSHDPSHVVELEMEMTEIGNTEATCENDATTTYRATAEHEGVSYQDEKTLEWEHSALGHQYPDLYAEEPDESAFTLTKNASGEVTAASLTLTCLRCNESQTIPATEVERMTWDANLCEDTEAEYYLFWDTDGIMEYAKYVTVPVTPTGHDYEAVYDWIKNQDGWYDGVNLILTCSHDPSHVVELEMDMTEIGNTGAACEDPATTTYRATAEYGGVSYQDEKTLEWEHSAPGHRFADPYENEPDESAFTLTKNANGEITDATMTLICEVCGQSVTLHATEIEVMSSEENLCEEGGEAEYYLFWEYGRQYESNQLEYSRYETATVGPLGHDYYEPTFMWNEGGDDTYLGATAIFTCRHNSDHTLEREATMETDEHAPNCLSDAYTVYTVTVEYEGETYTDERRVDQPETALGHEYPEPSPDGDVDGVTFNYVYADNGEIVSATMTRVCSVCGEEETLEATIERMVPEFLDVCEYEGSAEYYLFWEDIEFEKYVTVTVTPQGHDYGEPVFEWMEGGDDTYLGATATVTCSHNEDHVVELEVTMTQTHHEATCLDDAYMLYTASVEWEGETYTDTRTVTEEQTATGHDFPTPDPDEAVEGVSYEFTQDDETGEITAATVTLVCSVCGEEVTYEASQIEPTFIDLCEGGSAQYYIYWDELDFAKNVTVSITAQGHDYLEDHFDWYEDGEGGYTAELILVCSRNGDHTEPVEATVTKEGDVYTATATYGGATYTDTYTDPTGSGG